MWLILEGQKDLQQISENEKIVSFRADSLAAQAPEFARYDVSNDRQKMFQFMWLLRVLWPINKTLSADD